MTTTFIPYGAKAQSLLLCLRERFVGGASWVAQVLTLLESAAIICPIIILKKKTKMLWATLLPLVWSFRHVCLLFPMCQKYVGQGWSFIKRAGTVILCPPSLYGSHQLLVFVDGHFRWWKGCLAVSWHRGRGIAWILLLLDGATGERGCCSYHRAGCKKKTWLVHSVSRYGFAEVAEDGRGVGNPGRKFTAVILLPGVQSLCAPCFAAISAISVR